MSKTERRAFMPIIVQKFGGTLGEWESALESMELTPIRVGIC